MTSERIQRRIERLLDEAETAADLRDWQALRQRSEDILSFDPENVDAKGFLAAAERAIASGEAADAVAAQHAAPSASQTPATHPGEPAGSPLPPGGES